MRHNKKFNHLGRTASHRKAMLSNMACSLIQHKRISTTLAKAKALKIYVEPLINKSKDDSTHSRRTVFSYLQNKEVVTELFRDVAAKVANRPGGYTRILKTGYRLGDAAQMCIIELVDYNENLLKENAPKKKTTRRSRKAAPKAAEEAPKVAEAVEVAEAAPEVSAVAEEKESESAAEKE
ncbi:MAG: 50S ribosomal protein L17 [Prevotellaceae bacterium]|jgi:large subunit ribosomal protein L17|nr:50S ribosomal protein L17 [Prevotellaceae bacterium]